MYGQVEDAESTPARSLPRQRIQLADPCPTISSVRRWRPPWLCPIAHRHGPCIGIAAVSSTSGKRTSIDVNTDRSKFDNRAYDCAVVLPRQGTAERAEPRSQLPWLSQQRSQARTSRGIPVWGKCWQYRRLRSRGVDRSTVELRKESRCAAWVLSTERG